MFEGKPPTTHAGFPLDLSNGGQGELRAISWSELLAQFDAARELRSAFGSAGGEDGAGGEASFDPESARHIAAIGDGKPIINQDDLADGKPAMVNSRSAMNGAASGDPRK